MCKIIKALFGCAGPILLSHTKCPFVNGEKAVFTPEMDVKRNGTSAAKQGLKLPISGRGRGPGRERSKRRSGRRIQDHGVWVISTGLKAESSHRMSLSLKLVFNGRVYAA